MRTIPSILAPVVAALCLAAPTFAQTATTPTPAPVAQQAHGRQVKFTVKNQTKNPVSLQSGSQQINLAAGQSQTVKAPAGTKLVTTAPSDAGQTGTVVAEVSDGMDGSTVNVR